MTATPYDKLYTVLKYYLLGRNYINAVEALHYAREFHCGTRKDGTTPEFQHQVEIALYVTTLKDVVEEERAIIAVLLHDVAEDYGVSLHDLELKFGEVSRDDVWCLTKKYRGEVKDKGVYYEDLAKNPIASVCKGSDRVHNVNSMTGVFTLEKQESYIDEVETLVLPMIKQAKLNFPHQSSAYSNIQHMLRSQVRLVRAMIDATKHAN
jgi:(p)ppGpp synthase/HD superfamily hydrolase